MSIHTLEDGSVFANRYRIVRCMARGGMGAVYEVVHLGTNRKRALKVMHAHILHSEELRDRFHREAKVAAEVESDYIVEVFDAGIDESTEMPFLCMELLRGEELSRRLRRLGRIPPEDLALHLHQTALALDRMHEAGIVHRDLKPENLFITEGKDGPPRIKVLDFGIAKVVADGVNSGPATLSVGTPLYMSPEQFKAKGKLTGASDVYAIGMIAYTCLVGAPYWEEESRAGNIFAFGALVVQGPPEKASARAEKRGVLLPSGFDEWFSRITSVDPDLRFSPATAASRALSEILGAPVAQRGSSAVLTAPIDVSVREASADDLADALTIVPVRKPPVANAETVTEQKPGISGPDAITVVPARPTTLSEAVTVVPIRSAGQAAPSSPRIAEDATTQDTVTMPRLLEDDEGQTLVYKKDSNAKEELLKKVEAHRAALRAAQTAGASASPPAAVSPPAASPPGAPVPPARSSQPAARQAPPPATVAVPISGPAAPAPPLSPRMTAPVAGPSSHLPPQQAPQQTPSGASAERHPALQTGAPAPPHPALQTGAAQAPAAPRGAPAAQPHPALQTGAAAEPPPALRTGVPRQSPAVQTGAHAAQPTSTPHPALQTGAAAQPHPALQTGAAAQPHRALQTGGALPPSATPPATALAASKTIEMPPPPAQSSGRPGSATLPLPKSEPPREPARQASGSQRSAAFNTLTPSGAVLPAPPQTDPPSRTDKPPPPSDLIEIPPEPPDRSATLRVVAAIGVAAFLGVIVTVIALGGSSGPGPASDLTPSPVPSATAPEPPEPSATASATSSAPAPSPSESASAAPTGTPAGSSSAEPTSKPKVPRGPAPKGTSRPKYTQE